MAFNITIKTVGDIQFRKDGWPAAEGDAGAVLSRLVTVEVGPGTGKRAPQQLTVEVTEPYSQAKVITAVKTALGKLPAAHPDEGIVVEVV